MNKSLFLVGIASAMMTAEAGIAAGAAEPAAANNIGGMPRQAALGFRFRGNDGLLVVRNLADTSEAAKAGLADGDIIRRVNGEKFNHPFEGEALLVRLDAGEPIALTIERDGEDRRVVFVAPPKPLEAMDGVRSIYGSVETPDGARLRTIIAIPEGASGKLRPLLFTQWVSCDSIEYQAGDVSSEILARLARESGLALIRVERSANGDSKGPACHELDYDTEVAHYVHAFKAAMKHEAIDASKVFLNGSSLGSTTAPLVALALQYDGYDIAGIAIQGGGAETYYERMLTFDRHYLERRPDAVDPADIHEEMMRRAKFHYEYLVRGRDPDDVAKDSKDMALARADIRGLGQGEHYGRPYAWHQQAAKRNFLAAWAALDADALVVFNEFDQFEARYGHKLIADMVNRKRPGTATFAEQADVDHSNERYQSIEDAYAWRNAEPAWEETARLFTDWYNQRAAQ